MNQNMIFVFADGSGHLFLLGNVPTEAMQDMVDKHFTGIVKRLPNEQVRLVDGKHVIINNAHIGTYGLSPF